MRIFSRLVPDGPYWSSEESVDMFVNLGEDVKVTINETGVFITRGGRPHMQYIINPPGAEPGVRPKEIPKILCRVGHAEDGRTPAAKRMELHPVTVFWSAFYDNFRNSVKNFWR